MNKPDILDESLELQPTAEQNQAIHRAVWNLPKPALYSGWKITPLTREKLLRIFPPLHPKTVAHHITFQFGPDAIEPVPAQLAVCGHAFSSEVEALVVAVDGSVRRPDGGTFHVTWSLAPGVRPVQSNDLLACGWEEISPLQFNATPFVKR